MNTLTHGTFENVTVELFRQPNKVFPFVNGAAKRHYKNFQKPGHIYSMDYLEAIQQDVEKKESVGFRSWLKKILYSGLRKPTLAD